MKYEDPSMKIILFGTEDVIRTSLIEEGGGSGPGVGGNGDEQPWN